MELPYCTSEGTHIADDFAMGDSGSSITLGNFSKHLATARQLPEIVHSLELFNDSNPFDPLKLRGAIDSPSDCDPGRHGSLEGIIRCHVPSSDPSTTLILAVALGRDVNIGTLLGWPAFQHLELDLLTSKDCWHSNAMAKRFPILRRSTRSGKNLETDDPSHLLSEAFKQLRLDLGDAPNTTATDDDSEGYLVRTVQLH